MEKIGREASRILLRRLQRDRSAVDVVSTCDDVAKESGGLFAGEMRRAQNLREEVRGTLHGGERGREVDDRGADDLRRLQLALLDDVPLRERVVQVDGDRIDQDGTARDPEGEADGQLPTSEQGNRDSPRTRPATGRPVLCSRQSYTRTRRIETTLQQPVDLR